MKKSKIIKVAILALFSAVLLTLNNVGAISSNPYNDWKTSAINYPNNGQLVPAGPITITWDRLSIDSHEVIGYEVYLDNVLQNSTIIDEGDIFSCEVYTTKVAQHQVKILAQLSNNTKISTSVRNFYISKKGMGFYSGNGYSAIQDAQNMGLSWYYNWGTAPTYAGTCPNQKINFVPMIWGAYNGSNEQLTTIKNAGYKTVLGYNEPDFVDQSNVPVATAIANQHYFTNSGMRIGAPATAIQAPNSEWFNEYWQGINTDDIDFIPVHNYPGNIGVTDKEIKDNAKSFLNFINETHNKFNKPDRYGGDSGLFNTKADHDKNSMLKIGTLTTLGNDYRNLGNPEGYILPNLMGEIEPSIEDEYVDDYVNVMINGRSENVVLGSKFDKIDTPVKDGYVFSGWYSDEACTKEYDFDSIVTDNVTIYPKWLKMHTVTIDGIDNKVIDGNTAVKPLPSVKDGYVFKGWYSDSEYNNKFDFNEPIRGDIAIYSKWVKLVTVSVDNNKVLIESGTVLSRPDMPIKNGYTFAGWYSDEACTKEFDFAKPLLEDVTIYTKWKKVIDPMEKEDQTTSINSVKTGDNFAIQGYVLGLIGVMAAIVMMQKKYNK